MVQRAWRDGDVHAQAAVGPVFVVCRARGDRAAQGAGLGCPRDRPACRTAPSTISRELRRNAATRGGKLDYRASVAQWKAELVARRPKTAKLVADERLLEYVQDRLAGQIRRPDGTAVPGPATAAWKGRGKPRRQDRRWASAWSPEQISARLKIDFPEDESMRVSHEAIYQALYVQSRGALRRELVACLRTGRALRVPRARARGRGKTFVTDEVMISQRPAEAADHAVPGHWEGDLILGIDRSAIGTLVERTSRFVMLLHLPPAGDRAAPSVKHGPPNDRAPRRGRPQRDRPSDRRASRALAPLAGLGPGRRDVPARPPADRHRP
jgi:hypothetical protein